MAVKKIALARKFRKTMTEPEQLLWARLRRHGDGLAFRRQHPAGPYILDFYCPKARLAIEVDGTTHGEDQTFERDERRDNWLKTQTIHVYRVPAAEVYRDADAAADGIKLLADDLTRRR